MSEKSTNSLYIFDLDHTLIACDCTMVWNEFLVEEGLADGKTFVAEDRRLMALYDQGKLSIDDYLKFAMAPLVRRPISELQQLVIRCVKERIIPTHYPAARELIERLAAQQIDMIIISASPTFLVQKVAARLNIHNALGIDLVEQQGRYTSEILGVASYQQGKVTRLKQWLAMTGNHYDALHFYTDSINDLPLCEYVDHVCLINPCRLLVEHGRIHKWPILTWQL